MTSETADPSAEHGIQTWVVEVVVAVALFVLGAVVVYDS